MRRDGIKTIPSRSILPSPDDPSQVPAPDLLASSSPPRARRRSVPRQSSQTSMMDISTPSSSSSPPTTPSLSSVDASLTDPTQNLPLSPSPLPPKRRRNSVTVSALPVQRLRGIAMPRPRFTDPFSPEEVDVQSELPTWNDSISRHFADGQPEDALGLVEAMLDPSNKEKAPRPSTITYNIILRGFCNAHDYQTALTWFNQLLDHPHPAPLDPNGPLATASRPNREAWSIMLSTLAKFDVPALNRAASTFASAAKSDFLGIIDTDRQLVIDANIRYIAILGPGSSVAGDVLDGLLLGLQAFPIQDSKVDREATSLLVRLLHENGYYSKALQVIREHVDAGLAASALSDVRHELGLMIQSCYESFPINITPFSLDEALALAKTTAQVGIPPLLPRLALAYVQAFLDARIGDTIPSMSTLEWSVMAEAFCAAEITHRETIFPSLTKIISSHFDLFLAELRGASVELPLNISQLITETSMISPFSDNSSLSPPLIVSPSLPLIPTYSSACIAFDARLSRSIDDECYSKRTMAPFIGFSKLESGLRRGIYPTPETLGRLITALGRAKDAEKIRFVYEHAQVVLAGLDQGRQSTCWFHIENQMIEAMAHSGNLEAANVHRSRIIQYGGVPSADSYGALISASKDTTDDATVAIGLFEESQRLGTRPNTFLYNTIISQLSRARKAVLVLDLFRRMTDEGLQPSSVTYGAVICSCCRVGDSYSAAYLFEKMIAMPNFRPRATPYNTLIQYYSQNEPNREKALSYYQSLLAAGVKPSPHTYKLLLDCFGTIEPLQLDEMHRVFQELVDDPTVPVQGSHWASLIHAWGCVHKDLDRAIDIFKSISSHPSSAKTKHPLPDAIVFETMINVLVTLRRMDLVPSFLQRLKDAGIHETAYIANSLIKGHATTGNIEQARAVFENMHDPPIGVAGYNNRANDEVDPSHLPTVDTLIYREPSSWEVMCRAELEVGERERAVALLGRMTARSYPEALTSRIRRLV